MIRLISNLTLKTNKNPNSYFMFTGDDMVTLRNTVRDFRKLSFMGDINFICINETTPNLARVFASVSLKYEIMINPNKSGAT